MCEAVINTAIGSLRKDPHRRGELQDEDFYGRPVTILEENDNGWSYIRTQYGYHGYVDNRELITDECLVSRWKNEFKKVVIHPFADILDAPNVRGYLIITVCKGALLSVLASPDPQGYVKVGLCNGETGYIKEAFLGDYITDFNVEKEDNLRYDIVQTAKAYLGCQYRWGGKSPLGVDCSGLSFMAYQLNGITIYRDASIETGYPVKSIPPEKMKPADLLYFLGHVAIYLGDERYIHSTARNGSDGVVINSLNPKDILYREDLALRLKEVGSIFP
ncbi:MAG: glycoside hydrolase [Anaerocolumna sp.]|jgi:cell wall-associated NlpC family hydrolase|nr:glycoside hydrolase [Anaerocolumna sp.]